MNFRIYFSQIIRKHYPAKHELILSEAEKSYKLISPQTLFASYSSNPLDRRLDLSTYFLALIKTLEKQGADFETIKSICLEIASAYIRPKNKMEQYAKRLPAKLLTSPIAPLLVKHLARKANKKAHRDGFVANVITDKASTYGLGYGIDIVECGICKLFHKHEADKYTSILCEVDKLTASLAGLELIRKSTIANGADKCDFRFKKVEVRISSKKPL